MKKEHFIPVHSNDKWYLKTRFSNTMKKLCFILLCTLLSCSKDGEETYVKIPESSVFDPTPLALKIPENFPDPIYDFSLNPPTQEGFDLGKQLFYEGKLSATNTISCGECHRQDFAFTHHTHSVSHGVNGTLGTRNAQPLHNLIFLREFNWDGAVNALDRQPITPITAAHEMNETFANIIKKLQADPEYTKLFAAAFENGQIDTKNILLALSQFTTQMISADSKYDKVTRGEGNLTFTDQESAGQRLFIAKCASCHNMNNQLFTDLRYRNNGLPIAPEYNDIGRAAVTGLTSDNYTFRVPSLRNIELTRPYMHDGRFSTLTEVLDFYTSGIWDSETLDPLLQQEGQLGISLSEEEKKQLLAFLYTLTDTNFTQDQRFSEF